MDEKTLDKIKSDLLKIADAGEYDDMRREVERYFDNFAPELNKLNGVAT